MFTQLLQYNDIGLFLLRVAVAIIFLVHGLPKLSKSKEMSAMIGAPSYSFFVLGIFEVVSAIGLILGIYTQIFALILSLVMLGAIKMKIIKWKVPFNASDKTGWEFDFILFIANIVIILSGGGLIVF